jgi:heterodisulfide reductase subunit C
VVCPVGINLQDLWVNLREYLVQQGYPEPVVWAREAIGAEFNPVDMQDKVLSLIPADTGLQSGATLSAEVNTFSVCFGCKNCTTVCPVVGNYDNPQEVLGLLPHQIMHSVGLGLTDLALGSRMLWDCVTCYQCQEHCPQGVCVTDLFYELKNLAFRHLNKKTSL